MASERGHRLTAAPLSAMSCHDPFGQVVAVVEGVFGREQPGAVAGFRTDQPDPGCAGRSRSTPTAGGPANATAPAWD